MTGFTVGRKSGALVIRVVGAIVISAMTAKTGVGGIAVVASNMAGNAGVCNRSMCSDQRIEIIMIKI